MASEGFLKTFLILLALLLFIGANAIVIVVVIRYFKQKLAKKP